MTASRWFLRAAALILLAAPSVGLEFPARAQSLDDLQRQIQELSQAGKYADTLAAQRKLAAQIEKAEIATAGAPGEKTAGALLAVAWYALLAKDFGEALAVSERAHALAPGNLDVETNHAHALLLLGRVREARAIYLAYKGKPMSLTNPKLWEDVIAEDIQTLRAAGVARPAFAEIDRALGGKSTKYDADFNDLVHKIRQLHQAGNYAEAVPLAEKAIALARSRYGEQRAEFAVAVALLALEYEQLGRTAEAEQLYKRVIATEQRALGSEHAEVATTLNNLANLYRAQNRFADAEPLYKRALAILENAFGPDDPNVANGLHNLASVYEGEGRYAEAEPLLKRALAIQEKALGPNHPDVAATLNSLAGLYETQGHYAEVEPLMKRALAIDQQALGADHPEVAVQTHNLAVLYRDQGRYAEAEPLFKRALVIAEKSFGPNHPNVSTSLIGLSELYDKQGRYSESEPLYKRALAIDEKALGPNHPDVARDLSGLSGLYRAQGRYAEAEPIYKRVIAIDEKVFGPAHAFVGVDLCNLGNMYLAQSRFAEAEPLFKRALGIEEKALGPEHPNVGTCLGGLASLFNSQGRYAEAEPLYKRSIAIAEKALGADHPEVGHSLQLLAQMYDFEGRFGESEALYRRALDIHRKALGPGNSEVGVDLNWLADVHHRQGRDAEAEKEFKDGLDILEKATGTDHADVGSTLDHLAGLYKDERRFDEAEPLYKRALAVYEKAFGPNNTSVGVILNNLAELFRFEGRYAEAEPLYKRSLSIAKVSLGSEHPDVGAVLNNLALVNFSEGLWERAADYWRDSNDIIIRRAQRGTLVVGKTVNSKRTSETAQRKSEFVGRVKAISHISPEDGNQPRRVHDVFETAQWALNSEAAESLAQMAARGAKGDPKLAAFVRERQDLVTEWQRRDAAHTAAVALAPDARKRQADVEAENVARLAEIDRRISGLDVELAAKFPDYTALASPGPLPVEDVQAQLGADEALLLFLDTPEFLQAREETFLWVVTKTGMKWVNSDIGTAALVREVTALRCGLDFDGAWLAKESRCGDLLKIDYSQTDQSHGRPLPFDLARAYALYKALFGRVEDMIKDKRLLIVPSGPLTQLPFQVLVTEPPTTALPSDAVDYRHIAWLVRTHAITVLPAVSSLKALRQFAKRSLATELYIGFGDPLLDGEPAQFPEDKERAQLAREQHCHPTQNQRVADLDNLRGGTHGLARSTNGLTDVADIRRQAPLPETADELCNVALDLGVDPVLNVHIGTKATEAEVKRLSDEGTLARFRIIHFATHGAVAGDITGTSEPGLILTPPQQPTETDDGYLSASEVAALRLDADWVILSACNTAAGGAQNAEALSGLARAFFYAGARSLLVSHWSVNSDATVKLITKAVAELKSDPNIGRAEALRRSMLSMIDGGKDYEAHPAFWAPFVLVGEGTVAQ